MRRDVENTVKEISRVFSEINDVGLVEDLLKCLLTVNELKEIARRWEVVKLLDRGFTQRRIAKELKMSLCKITRGSKELKKEGSAFKKVINAYLNNMG
jgi:TrpR family trp operon transcriptional repressor